MARVCKGIFTTALRNKKISKNSHQKYLTLLPQCVACYLAAYYVEGNPFKRVVHFEVFYVHKKSPFLMGNHFESSLGKTTSGLVMRKRANKRIRSLERSTVWRNSLGLTSFRRSDVCYLRCQSGRFRGNSTTRQRNW